MPKTPKVEDNPTPKIHYTDIIDPEYWQKRVIPVIAKAIEDVEAMSDEEAV